jgi:hypothetical protein
MSLKFDDIMKKFYDDPKLGIKKEEAPVNATGTAVAGTGDDSSTVVVKKKKNPYDGRTKEARQFFNRMSERKQKREEKARLTKQVQENTLERASILAEDNVDVLKKIVKDKQNQQIKFKDGKMRVDLFTASAVTQVFDAVNKSNQEKMRGMLNGTKAQFMKIADFALSKAR